MKQIPLSQGLFATVDDSDYEWLSAYKWHAHARRGRFYARSSSHIKMHRLILGINDPSVQVDHINGNRLDNRRVNIRLCTAAENNKNMGIRSNNTSGYKGVWWHRVAKKWAARIKANKTDFYLGLFDTIEEAARAYNIKAADLHGEFARLNQIPGQDQV